MELFVKPYTGQPARIGIKYTYQFQAVKAYEELVNLTGGSELSGVLELSGNNLVLTLTSDYNGKTIQYKPLEFRLAELQKLIHLTPPFIFVHIYPQQNALLVAKPFRKSTFLEINHLELRGALAAHS